MERASPSADSDCGTSILASEKVTSFHEPFKIEFSADFFNLFNHVNFFQTTLNLTSPATFGVINQELIPADRTEGSRWIQLGLRVSF